MRQLRLPLSARLGRKVRAAPSRSRERPRPASHGTPTTDPHRTHLFAAGLPITNSTHLAHLQTVPSTRPHPHSPSPDRASPEFIAHSSYSFELFTVPSRGVLSEHWPEESERDRKWVEGWDAVREAIRWGERGELMLAAAEVARAKLDELRA